MLGRLRLVPLAAAVLLCGRGAHAQSASTAPPMDPRWYAWLGCWAPDTSRDGSGSSGTTCVIPVDGARGTEAVMVSRGAIISREPLDGSGRPHPIDGNGCHGTETVNWSTSGRRVYTHAEYTCGSAVPGASIAVFGITPNGTWLRVEKVRSGSGSIVTVTRRRPTVIVSAVSVNTARSIEGQQRAIATARATASAPISTDEILDAIHNLDGDVVRAWLAANDQTWTFDAAQIVAMADAGVPIPVLEVISPMRGTRAIVAAPQVDVVVAPPQAVYAVDDGVMPVMTTMRQCPPAGCAGMGPYSAYSGYNGYGYNPIYPYPYQFPYPYPYTPFNYGFSPFTTVSFANTNGVNRGNGVKNGGHDGRDGRHDGGHTRPRWPSQPQGRGGGGPVRVGGGRGR